MKFSPLLVAALAPPSNAFAPTPPSAASRELFRDARASSPVLLTAQESASTTITNTNEEFKNDGPFSFMEEGMDLINIKEGKRIAWGMLTTEVTEVVSDDEASRRREEAARSLVNIDDDERARRDAAGDVLLVVAAATSAYLSIFADGGDFAGHVVRLGVLPFFALGYAYKLSAKEGLCNIAQSGMWDVDGNGMSKIEDPTVAYALLEKVNSFNSSTGVQATAAVLLFASVPKGTAILMSIIFVVYVLKGRVPSEA